MHDASVYLCAFVFQFITNMINVNMTSVCQVSFSLCSRATPGVFATSCFFLFPYAVSGTCSVSVVPKATVDYTNAVCTCHPHRAVSLSVCLSIFEPVLFVNVMLPFVFD